MTETDQQPSGVLPSISSVIGTISTGTGLNTPDGPATLDGYRSGEQFRSCCTAMHPKHLLPVQCPALYQACPSAKSCTPGYEHTCASAMPCPNQACSTVSASQQNGVRPAAHVRCPPTGGQAAGPAAGNAAPGQGRSSTAGAASTFASGLSSAAQSLVNRMAGRNLRGVNMLADGLQQKAGPSAAQQ